MIPKSKKLHETAPGLRHVREKEFERLKFGKTDLLAG
jgi:hypothetical protein